MVQAAKPSNQEMPRKSTIIQRPFKVLSKEELTTAPLLVCERQLAWTALHHQTAEELSSSSPQSLSVLPACCRS